MQANVDRLAKEIWELCRFQRVFDYLNFIMESHIFPDHLIKQVNDYVYHQDEVLIVQDTVRDFMEFLNPSMRYEVHMNKHFDILKSFWMFENAEVNEVMLIAHYMKP